MLQVIEDPKELLYMWIIPTDYWSQKLKLRNFQIFNQLTFQKETHYMFK